MTHTRMPLALTLTALTLMGCSLPGLPGDPADTPTAPPPTLNATPAPPSAEETLAMLAATEPPHRDRIDLAARYLGITDVSPTLSEPVSYRVGDVEQFWAENSTTDEVFEITAELVYETPHVYMWVEQGVGFDMEKLAASAERFETETYPINRRYFGEEWSPGIDGNAHLHILHTAVLGSQVSGYFYSPSEFPASIVPYSNEKEMFYINPLNTPPGLGRYDAVLAHEFQHMIQWHVDRNEEAWVDEGLAELAAYLNGFGPSGFTQFFMMHPDIQLTDWPETDMGRHPFYGADFLFHAYFLARFGEDALYALAHNPLNGMLAVNDTLAQIDAGLTADAFFGQWVIANLLNDPDVAGGLYAYPDMPDLPALIVETEHYTYPVESEPQEVRQYGTDTVRLYGPDTVRITFEGSQQVRIIPTNTGSGSPFVWWSNRGDDSDTRLTARFDLTGVSEAALDYDVWYWFEEYWDYGHVAVSEDGGRTWATLATPHTTTDNPHGNAYGPGYTGASLNQPDADAEGWLHETLDLTPYAGREIWLRFEAITDDAVNQPGMALDNICIAAVGFCDDVESGAGIWTAEGFVRHNNILPQRFTVQVVVWRDDGTVDVLPLSLDATNRGALEITIGREPAILVISGLTPFTTERAGYVYRVERVDN